jgi:hypothetical protein
MPTRRAHVLLSSNVFVATHRALALGLAAAPELFVRASRREPEMLRQFSSAVPDAFTIVADIRAEAGDQLFAYGADTTLEALRSTLPRGVLLRAHGSGFGIAALEANATSAAGYADLAASLALDTALFDQRGCLSPRPVLFEGSPEAAHGFAQALAKALVEREAKTPPGALPREEAAELLRLRAALGYAGPVEPAGRGFVAVPTSPLHSTPIPFGRSLAVLPVHDAATHAHHLAAQVTTYAVTGSTRFAASLARALPRARPSEFGRMQTPPFDGPADPRGTKR